MSTDVNVGSHIGQYRILRKLGAGGMGTVFLGEHILLKRRAAIKTLLPSLCVHKEIVDRFFNEARATSAISDPGVVQIFDFGYHVDGTAYIVMELLEGEALSARIDRLGKLPVGEALRIARQGAGALAAAHDRGIIHRDLKPENVFLVRDAEAQSGERAKILDFGICKLDDDECDRSITQTGAMMGTPLYMSPEQCQGAGKVDHRSDIYALGCVLFHMLTGRVPFDGEGSGEIIAAHLKDAPPVPSSIVELPNLVDELVLKCLEKAPEARFQTMGEVQHAIEHVLARLSAPEPVADLAPPALLLKRGFRSMYDGNFGTAVPTKVPEQTVERSTVPERRRKPTTLGEINGEVEPWPRKYSVRAAAVVFMVGVVGALFATTLALDRSEDSTAHADDNEPAELAPATAPRLPADPVPVEQKPADPIATTAAPDPEHAIDTKNESNVARSERGVEQKPVAKAAVGKPRKVTRRAPPVRRTQAKPTTPEDLYDTR